MAIASLDQYIASNKQRVRIIKTTTRTSVALVPFSVFDIAGDPGAGTLAGTSTTQGVVPTDATAGCPNILFTMGTGYLSKVEFANTVTSRLALFDMVYKAGAYSYAAGTTALTSQPNILGRSPDGYGGSYEFWLEVSTAFSTGTAWQVQLTYTNSAGQTGRSTVITAALAAASLTQGKLLPLALQSGDSGVQRLESVIVTNGGTAMTAGAFNILVLRPLWTQGRIMVANMGDIHDLLKTGMPIVYPDSALYLMVTADSTSTGLPELTLEIANG